MDWDLLKIVLTLAQAAKEWPLTTLIVVCITALLAIPVVMVTKRWLDMTWLNRDSYITMLAEHNGMLKKEVEGWKQTAENALSGERRLIDQMSGLQKSLGNAQQQLTEAREKEEKETQIKIELEEQLTHLKYENNELEQEIKTLKDLDQKRQTEFNANYDRLLYYDEFKIAVVQNLGLTERYVFDDEALFDEIREIRKDYDSMKKWLDEASHAGFFTRVADILSNAKAKDERVRLFKLLELHNVEL